MDRQTKMPFGSLQTGTSPGKRRGWGHGLQGTGNGAERTAGSACRVETTAPGASWVQMLSDTPSLAPAWHSSGLCEELGGGFCLGEKDLMAPPQPVCNKTEYCCTCLSWSLLFNVLKMHNCGPSARFSTPAPNPEMEDQNHNVELLIFTQDLVKN